MKLAIPPGVAARMLGPLVSTLARTWRVETVHAERWSGVVEAGRPHVFLLWHDALLPLLWWHRGRGITIVVSLIATLFPSQSAAALTPVEGLRYD